MIIFAELNASVRVLSVHSFCVSCVFTHANMQTKRNGFTLNTLVSMCVSMLYVLRTVIVRSSHIFGRLNSTVTAVTTVVAAAAAAGAGTDAIYPIDNMLSFIDSQCYKCTKFITTCERYGDNDETARVLDDEESSS